MIYTDKIHLVADTLEELHNFAKTVGLKRRYFEGVRKGHPHYDLTNDTILSVVLNEKNVNIINTRYLLLISKQMQ